MFGTVLTSLVTLMHAYVFWRLGSMPAIARALPLRRRALVFAALWGIFILGRVYGHGNTGPLAATLEFLGMNWMGALFLICTCLALADIVTCFGLLLRRHAARIRLAALMAGVALAALALFQGLRPPVVESYEVRVPGLPPELEGKTIAGLSDLHLGSLVGAGWLKGVVSRVQSLSPEMIVLLGDIIEGHDPPGAEILSEFRGLRAPMGVWAVPGNHDRFGGNGGFLRLLGDNGIHALNSGWQEAAPGIYMAGASAPRGRHNEADGCTYITRALEGIPPGGLTILLSHYPDHPEQAAAGGVSLMLSGHTHGGQIWPFGYMVQRRYPFLKGMHDIDGMAFIVSRGASTWGPRMRLFSPGEILHITLRRAAP